MTNLTLVLYIITIFSQKPYHEPSRSAKGGRVLLFYRRNYMKFAIDAGHGPDTLGKRSPDGSLREFVFNSNVADRIVNLLKGYQDVDTLKVYKYNVDVPLKTRTDAANAWKADVYVSVHANAYGDGKTWNDGQGIETYVYTTKPKAALLLATEVQNQLLRATGRPNRGVKSADFHVLRETDMTAILCECGFMTNKEECELLKHPRYQEIVAAAIVKGLEVVYKLKKVELVRYEIIGDKNKMSKLAAELSDRGYEVHIKE